jgi:hypothetical protein
MDHEEAHPFERFLDEVFVKAQVRFRCINGDSICVREQPLQRGGVKTAWPRGARCTVIDDNEPGDGPSGPFKVAARPYAAPLQAVNFSKGKRSYEPWIVAFTKVDEGRAYA